MLRHGCTSSNLINGKMLAIPKVTKAGTFRDLTIGSIIGKLFDCIYSVSLVRSCFLAIYNLALKNQHLLLCVPQWFNMVIIIMQNGSSMEWI